MGFFMNSLSERYTNVKFANIDIDNLSKENFKRFDNNFNLSAIPSFYLFFDGILVNKLIGSSQQKLESFIISHLADDNFDQNKSRVKNDDPVQWQSVKPISKERATTVKLRPSPSKNKPDKRVHSAEGQNRRPK